MDTAPRNNTPPRARSAPFGRDFILVVIGQIISLFGNAILRFALPLYLLRQTGSSELFGVVTACSFLPMIVLSLMGGVLADRINKRNIMVALDFTTAALVLLFYLGLGELPTVPIMILFLMMLYGISGTYQPAVQASIPILVASDKLMVANAIINQVSTLSGLLGPVIGGLLFGTWGITPILMVSAGCFAVSAIMEIFIHIPHQKRPRTVGVLAVVRDDLVESFRFVREKRPIFFSVVAIVAAFNLVLSAMMVVGMPILIVQVLQLSDSMLGYAQGIMALGGLAGGLLMAVVAKKLTMRTAHRLLIICALSVGVIGLALLMDLPVMATYAVITGMSFVAMAVSTLFSVQMLTVVQQQIPPALVGKIMAVMIAISMCAQPVGQAIYGVLFGAAAHSSWAVLLGAAVVSAVIALLSKNTFARLHQQMAGPTAAQPRPAGR
ncbi:MFS transporter [Neobittarella massiliensis]|uniref:MFS transporter n=1 Tax=Neobittarella massiliensis (ex Bilen et al. 2018) TaxID=2041842 RepID=A0A8J6IN08_9FIRM|nr:MFS transporter [Neobittarella massiliensis]MBC3516579.1 MFS transporter [Neobittarella massiliensis]